MFAHCRNVLLVMVWAGAAGTEELRANAMPFSEEAAARGVNYLVTQGAYTDSFGCGIAAVDLDGDLDADLILTGRADGVVGIYENIGNGQFVDRSANSGIPAILTASGVVCADYDGDSDLDIYFSNWLTPNILMRNDGGFVFVDVSVVAGVNDAGAGAGCAWADFDLDGYVDLYVANRTGTNASQIPNRLYRNLGNGTFVDVAPPQRVDDNQLSFQGFFFDMDRDGDSDLFVSSDFGDVTRLFENVNGNYTDRTATSGVGVTIKGMGVTAADFNLDGLFDIYETNTTDGNPLFMNQGNGQFIDQSAAWNVRSNRIGWGALFFDYDNDAFLDLYVCNQVDFFGNGAQNRLFVHGGLPPCNDVSASLGVNVGGESYCLASADFDNDGDIDLVVQNYNEPIRLLINHEGQSRNWLKVKVFGEGANTYAIGAIIEADLGFDVHIREVRAGENFKSQNEHIAHFGLGARTYVDELTVTWPGGMQKSLSNVAANQLAVFVPDSRLGDTNRDGVVDGDDIQLFISAILGQVSSPLLVAFSDMNGDGVADIDDLSDFVNRLMN